MTHKTTYREQLKDGVTLEDLKAFAWDIGCTINGNDIAYDTREQGDKLQTWMTEHGFGEPQRAQ